MFTRLVEGLNDDNYLAVLQLLAKELGFTTLNKFLVQIFVELTKSASIKCLADINNSIQSHFSISTSNSNSIPNISTKQSQNKNIQSHPTTAQITEKDTVFPLLRLPTDIVKNTSFFLNEKDIFVFEQCCSLFYQMINNTSYLKQTENFKTFTINNDRLSQMTNAKNCFFKYSKATTLDFELNRQGQYDVISKIDWYSLSDSPVPLMTKHEELWDKARAIGDKDWLITLMKSVKVIHFNSVSRILLSKLPIDILFDPYVSQLQGIALQESRIADKILNNDISRPYIFFRSDIRNDEFEEAITQSMDKFEEKYSKFQSKLQKEGTDVKLLEFVHRMYFGSSSERIEWDSVYNIGAKHVHIIGMRLAPMDLNIQMRRFSGLKIITFERDADIKIGKYNNNNDKMNNNRNDIIINNKKVKEKINGRIETIRLIDFDLNSNTTILNDKKLIESCNFDNSLKNITININLTSLLDFYNQSTLLQNNENWLLAFKNIFSKSHYYNLTNVNILFNINSYRPSVSELTTWREQIGHFFKILSENLEILKYQFKNFNIGFDINDHYYVLKWNDKIDGKYLNSKKIDILNHLDPDTYHDQIDNVNVPDQLNTSEPKVIIMTPKQEIAIKEYFSLKTQWLSCFECQYLEEPKIFD